MNNTELRKEAQKYIEENNIVSNTYEIEKAFIDGAKLLRDKPVNNGVSDDVMSSVVNEIAEEVVRKQKYCYRQNPDTECFDWLDVEHDWIDWITEKINGAES